jgi:hypothetical protein
MNQTFYIIVLEIVSDHIETSLTYTHSLLFQEQQNPQASKSWRCQLETKDNNRFLLQTLLQHIVRKLQMNHGQKRTIFPHFFGCLCLQILLPEAIRAFIQIVMRHHCLHLYLP